MNPDYCVHTEKSVKKLWKLMQPTRLIFCVPIHSRWFHAFWSLMLIHVVFKKHDVWVDLWVVCGLAYNECIMKFLSKFVPLSPWVTPHGGGVNFYYYRSNLDEIRESRRSKDLTKNPTAHSSISAPFSKKLKLTTKFTL